MTQQMVLITAEQERVLKELQLRYTNEQILTIHTNGEWRAPKNKVLKTLSVDDMAIILYGVGYEVRKTPEEETLQRYEDAKRLYSNNAYDSDKRYWFGYRDAIEDMLRIHGIKVKGINE